MTVKPNSKEFALCTVCGRALYGTIEKMQGKCYPSCTPKESGSGVEELREKIWRMIEANAEDTDMLDDVDKTGTFTTFRAEYLLNDIEALVSQAVAEERERIKENIDKFCHDCEYGNCHSLMIDSLSPTLPSSVQEPAKQAGGDTEKDYLSPIVPTTKLQQEKANKELQPTSPQDSSECEHCGINAWPNKHFLHCELYQQEEK